MYERGVKPQIAVGHDFRHYSLGIKQALIVGLMNSGVEVLDIGMALSPMAYFAQFYLDCPGVAMVTASHNSNGWTGVKMGIEPPLTFGPDEMSRLKEIVLQGLTMPRSGGSYKYVDGVKEAYIEDLVKDVQLKNRIKVVAACGNGTAGAFVPEVLERIGAEVIAVECELDYSFPKYNPNPEDMKMLHAMRDEVLKHGADVASKTDYYKTGHSYIKRRVNELDALVGFEKSGHYFFNSPIGRGYDCGLTSAIAILQMLDRNQAKSMADLRRDLPMTFGSPTMSPFCADEDKYGVPRKKTN